MHAIHRRLVQPFQFLGRGDVRQHHEFLDQPMAVEPRARRDAEHPSGVVEHHLPLRQIEIERAARGAGREQRAERGIEVRATAGRDRRPRHAPAAPARR